MSDLFDPTWDGFKDYRYMLSNTGDGLLRTPSEPLSVNLPFVPPVEKPILPRLDPLPLPSYSKSILNSGTPTVDWPSYVAPPPLPITSLTTSQLLPTTRRERTSDQRRRLAMEERILSQELPQFKFFNKTGDTYVEGWETPNNGSKSFCLHLPVPAGFPYTMPSLFLKSPCPLRRYGGIGVFGEVSHEDHTWGLNDRGHLEICHMDPENWDPSTTLVKVLFTGLVWINIYLEHLRTGRSIDSVFQEWQRRYR